MADLRLNILGDDGASVSLDAVSGKLLGLGKVLADFSKQSLKAFEEQAKADRQLAAVAGEATDAFKAQAAALQSSLGVSDDHIQKMQTMLLRYGEAPAQIDKTIRAMLDFSAATGQDAEGAISQLTSSVTTGKAAFKDLGLVYDQTGSRGDVLKNATDALAKKFGGSAQAEADTLAGSVAKAKQMFGELQETFGAAVYDFAQKTGIVDSLAEAFRGLNTAIGGGDDQQKRYKKRDELNSELLLIQDALGQGEKAYMEMYSNRAVDSTMVSYSAAMARIDEIKSALYELDQQGKKANGGLLSAKGAANGIKAGKAGSGTEGQSEAKAALEQQGKQAGEMINGYAKYRQALSDYTKNADEDEAKVRDARIHDEIESQKKLHDSLIKERDKWNEHQAAVSKKEEQQWAQAGAAIGSAFASALSSAIEEMASGGDVDITETVGGVLAAVLGVAGGVIGTAIGGPGIGTAIGAGLGGIAGSAVKGLTKRRRRHSGGYAGDDIPRYHGGTWVGGMGTDEEPAILQRGEHVLSRAAVAAMGGPRGVEAAKRGGGGAGMTINVNAFDTSNFAEYLGGPGGRAVRKALQAGRGPIPGIFGGH